MQSSSQAHQFIQIIFVLCLMGIIAWLANWQETPALQLSEQEDQLEIRPWSETHLIMPVSAPVQYYSHSEHTQAM